MKTIGIIGGIGPQATFDFEARLHRISQKYILSKANSGYPPLWVYYMREAPVKLKGDGTPVSPFEPSEKLLEIAHILGKKCDFLVIASNSPHIFLKEIEQAAGKKVVSMIGAVVAEIKRRGLKKVGVMAIGGTLKNGLYQKPLNEAGIQTEIISDGLSQRLDGAIFKVMEGREDEDGRNVAREGVRYLEDKGCQAVILGCTEVPFLLSDQLDDEKLINPIEILAEAAVRFAIE